MFYICISDEKKKQDLFVKAVLSFDKDASVIRCSQEKDALYEIDTRDIVVAVLDIDSKKYEGLELARNLHEYAPKTKCLLVSKDADSAVPAFKTRAFGYLVKPDIDSIISELKDIGNIKKKNIMVKTFGTFDMFVDKEPVKFGRAKSKELLAYLVYRRGTGTSASELIVNLWEDKDVDRTTRSMIHNLLSDIKKTLNSYGIDYIFSSERNCYRIYPNAIDCDYYNYLDDEKRKDFTGEFMSEYEWSVFVSSQLSVIQEKRLNI